MYKLGKRIVFIGVLSCIFFAMSGLTYVGADASAGTKKERFVQKYTFTTDWVTAVVPTWEKILGKFNGKSNIHYLEVGVFEGRSLLWMLENVFTHQTATVTGIDFYIPTELLNNIIQSGGTDKINIIKGSSQIELRKLPLKFYDVIYIDGGHFSAAVLTDAVLAWPLLKAGGILIFDDYGLPCEGVDYCYPDDRPKNAIDDFIRRYSKNIEILDIGWQCIIRKKSYFDWE